LRNKPWLYAHGPTSEQGKRQAVRNAKRCQKADRSVREVKADLAAVRQLIRSMRQVREELVP
jgi:hypothetical protein